MARASHAERPAMGAAMGGLLLDGIGHAYDGVVAVHDLTLAVGAGEVVCLLGPSGCGKTTALRVAAGLERLQRGRVAIAGRVVAGDGVDLPPEDRGVGLVFQDYALFPHLSVRDNVAFGLRGMAAADRRRRARAVLERVGLAELIDAWPHTLSGGQQQRVALARALAPEPGVMLLDEPFSGLDTRLRDQVRDETLHVLKESGAATLLVTHDPEEAMFMADRIAVMRAGRLEQVGVPADLYCSPVSAFVCSFFGDVNRVAGVVAGGRVGTPFGPVAAPLLREGTPAEVLIRPEAIRLAPCAEDAPRPACVARVIAARMLGRSSLIHLGVARADGPAHHVHARVPGRFLPVEGSVLAVTLDLAQTFVFARETPA
ncbi:MAG: ABC transporter ATP-binding protein [Alphaproteobacteria bacterium]|nr:ABC transporter ATP-binding protein [Alphaproteobacteria bacterium]